MARTDTADMEFNNYIASLDPACTRTLYDSVTSIAIASTETTLEARIGEVLTGSNLKLDPDTKSSSATEDL